MGARTCCIFVEYRAAHATDDAKYRDKSPLTPDGFAKFATRINEKQYQLGITGKKPNQ